MREYVLQHCSSVLFHLSKFFFKLLGADVSVYFFLALVLPLHSLLAGECAVSSDPLVKVAIE